MATKQELEARVVELEAENKALKEANTDEEISLLQKENERLLKDVENLHSTLPELSSLRQQLQDAKNTSQVISLQEGKNVVLNGETCVIMEVGRVWDAADRLKKRFIAEDDIAVILRKT